MRFAAFRVVAACVAAACATAVHSGNSRSSDIGDYLIFAFAQIDGFICKNAAVKFVVRRSRGCHKVRHQASALSGFYAERDEFNVIVLRQLAGETLASSHKCVQRDGQH